MKVKIFSSSWDTELEPLINKWLEENKDIEILRQETHSNIRFDRYTYGTNDICNTYYEFTVFLYYRGQPK